MNSPRTSDHGSTAWLPGLLMALAVAAFMAGLSDAPIERAEIYFLDAARAMVERGDWLVPYYRGEPFYDKPPLTYWLLALGFGAFGPSLFAGRLVAALLALATLGATHFFVKRLIGPEEDRQQAAFFATAILGTSYAFLSFARLAMSDMLLTLFTLLAGGVYLRSELESRPRLLVICGLLLGFGFLAKGPIAWIDFAALLLAFAVVNQRLPRIFNAHGLAGILGALGAGLGWFFLVYIREGGEPIRWFFLRENLQRFAAPTYDSAEPFWFYLPVYAVEGLPWSILAVPAAGFALRSGSPEVLRMLLGWSVLMLVPRTLSRGKIDYYLLPILAPLGMVIGAYLALGRPSTRTLRILAGATGLLLLGGVFFPMLPPPFAPPLTTIKALRVFLGLAALGCFMAAVRPTARVVVSMASAAVLGTALFLFGAIVPAYRSAQPTEAFLQDIARERVYTPDLEVVVCDDTLRLQRDILFSLRIPAVEQCELWAAVSSARKFLIIATADQEASLRTAERVRHIATRDHIPADVTRVGTLLKGARVSSVGLLANFPTDDPVARWKENREWKRWLETPEGRKAQAEYEEEQGRRSEGGGRPERK